ncbi:Bifunctional ligase/repressor BirA [Polaribacter huanghezhanensis]|uniref:biotin--[acetyl-CoA-carboxylase] ligase n=1 Tax=Polaribacter huanghezhanensis TaxID=1354726 RepID=UPI002647AB9B|nr:biotin--[acetyl-CoA-carboxylase] ligase [Polaribacter huanghezhanensis]WKD84820.1 Bifunctional ligase/repressor BirA [Polaribacter huanghezhanensis]
MRIIKLNAIDSTNSFLKEMAQSSLLENFTVIVAKKQIKGRGQMGTSWLSEANKNLLCSVFVRFDSFPAMHKVLVNYAVSIALVNVLNSYKMPKVAIKWPNDILSSNKKICGILVENVMQKNEIKSSIIGVGLNVNQLNFPTNFNATSMLKEIETEVDIDEFLNLLIAELKTQISYITNSSTNVLKKNYLKHLYRKNIPAMFKNSKGVLFMGKIVDVSSIGKLQIELEDDSIKEFGIKEVSFV